jgi:ComEC/Rec2-related protein
MIEFWWRRLPLGLCCVAAIPCILLADSQPGSPSVWQGLALIMIGAAISPFGRRISRAYWSLLLVGCLFGGLHQRRIDQTFGHPLLAWLEEPEAAKGRQVEVWADEIRSEVTPTGRVRSLLQVREIREAYGEQKVWGSGYRVRAQLPEGHPPLRSASCRLAGVLRAPPSALNSGEFDARTFALREGVLGDLGVTHVRQVELDSWSLIRLLREGANHCRSTIQKRLGVGLEKDPEALSVIRAMVLGSDEDTDPRIEDAFRRSGTLHVFAVSGLHVALISIILQALVRPLCLRRVHLVVLVVPLVFAYAYVTGWRPSAARAALMVAVVLSSTLVMRRANLLNNLGGSALVLLAADTHQLFQAGFQLSFGVLFTIALFAAPLMERCKPWTELDSFIPPALASIWQRSGTIIRRHLAGLFTVSAAAWIGSLPLMWFHFHTITPAALVANCLLIPLAFVCLGVACTSLAVSMLPFSGWIQILLNNVCATTASLMIDSASAFAAIPGASFNVPPMTESRETPAVELRWFALRYGAEAGLLRMNGRDWMLDCGDADSFASVVYPALRQSGVNRLHGVFLSHADSRHIGGLEPLVQTARVSTLYHSVHEPWRFDSGASKMRRALERLPLESPKWPARRALVMGDVVALGEGLRPSRLTVLYPGIRDANGLADDRGLVARLELGGLRVLWAADAGFITENALVDRREDLRCDVLICGAHEGDVHGSWSFLAAAAPSVIVATGSDDDPALALPRSVERYSSESKSRLLVFPRCGEVRIWLDEPGADHFSISTYEGDETIRVPLQRPPQVLKSAP